MLEMLVINDKINVLKYPIGIAMPGAKPLHFEIVPFICHETKLLNCHAFIMLNIIFLHVFIMIFIALIYYPENMCIVSILL